MTLSSALAGLSTLCLASRWTVGRSLLDACSENGHGERLERERESGERATPSEAERSCVKRKMRRTRRNEKERERKKNLEGDVSC